MGVSLGEVRRRLDVVFNASSHVHRFSPTHCRVTSPDILMALNAPVASLATGSSTSIQPNEFTLRSLQSITDTVDSTDDLTTSPTAVFPGGDNLVPEVEEELSEQQLRELYDAEEINRFLNLFSAVSICR